MRSLNDYGAGTSNYELYHFLAEAIIQNSIVNFSDLLAFAKAIPLDAQTSPVFERLFVLIRKLYWGFFRDINPSDYPKLWKELVLPNSRFPGCGDLKRNLTISDIFVAILDVHGYTGFCDKNKNNLSMLKALDELMQVEMTKLAKARDVILQRRQGDEMVLVGTSALDIIELSLDIIEVFTKKKNRSGDVGLALPDMHISVGIAGGNKFTPFIITIDGDLSGGVVNTAARLQSRANELSRDRSRVVMTRIAHVSYLSERKARASSSCTDRDLGFLDSGYIQFKGLEVAVSELVFEERDRYRCLVEKDLQGLFKAIEAQSWKDNLFISLVNLYIRLFKFMPAFRQDARLDGMACKLSNDYLVEMAQAALNAFKIEQDYRGAIAQLARLLDCTRQLASFDRVSLEYGQQILAGYQQIVADFERRMNAKVRDMSNTSLSARHRQLFEESRKAVLLQERLVQEVLKGLPPIEFAQLWAAAVTAQQKDAQLAIRSGKQ